MAGLGVNLDLRGLCAECIGRRIVAIAGLGIRRRLIELVMAIDLERAGEGGDLGPGQMFIGIEAYAVVRKDRKMSAATRKTLAYFLSPKAQAMLPGLGYAPLPKSQLAQARQQLKTAR